jgi:hypothetical protein
VNKEGPVVIDRVHLHIWLVAILIQQRMIGSMQIFQVERKE